MIKTPQMKTTSDYPSVRKSIFGATMKYKNSEMKIDEIAAYFRDGKINLIPPFQRGRAWTPTLRQKLLENIVRGRPIPAIFLYKEAAGSKYSYNILDGKQRLESLLLFIGDKRGDLNVPNWADYFFGDKGQNANFKINIARDDERPRKLAFSDLEDKLVREFREYSISTIEIDLDSEDGSLDEVISLFIDINQLGVKVNRWDIVRTMTAKNKLLSDVFKLIAIKQRRKKSYLYMMNRSNFTFILKRLNIIQALDDRQQKVDRMWERLLEIVLFVRNGQHKPLAHVLKAMISSKVDSARISVDEMAKLKHLFEFLKELYKENDVSASRLATDQIHFYTMVTSLHALKLTDVYDNATLIKKLTALAKIIDGKKSPPKDLKKIFKDYMELASRRTTDSSNRSARQLNFAQLVEAL